MYYNLRVKKGENFTQAFRYGKGDLCGRNFSPYDLTGWQAECRFYTTDFDTPILTASTINSKIIITPTEGKFALNLLPADVANLQNNCYYRLVLTRPDNYKIVVLYGRVTIL